LDTPLPPTLRQEELDEFLRACAMVTAPTRDISRALVRHLHELLRKAPTSLKRHFAPPANAIADPLFDADALEQILMLTTKKVGILASRSRSGNSTATVALPELGIERTFSSTTCLAVAMAGAIAAGAHAAIIADRKET
jgi:hypothetical protein|tara:strand:+ start:143 stop:559 length:417 start_codon:yes stop_codon:yes gene_type:complete